MKRKYSNNKRLAKVLSNAFYKAILYLGDDAKKLSFFNQAQQRQGSKMENQHRKIKGYRELSQEEIDLMNDIKQKGVELGELYNKLELTSRLRQKQANDHPTACDMRWLAIGKTHLQQGLMAWTRAIAKPDFF